MRVKVLQGCSADAKKKMVRSYILVIEGLRQNVKLVFCERLQLFMSHHVELTTSFFKPNDRLMFKHLEKLIKLMM